MLRCIQVCAPLVLLAVVIIPLPVSGCADHAGEAPAAAALIDSGAAGLLERVRRGDARVVLLNVWATWCAPCVEEMPDLLRLRRDMADRGFELLLVSADFPDQRSAVEAFLRKQGVDFATYFKNEADMAFIEALEPEWSGALPATIIYSGSGEKLDFWVGKADYRTLTARVEKALELADSHGRTQMKE